MAELAPQTPWSAEQTRSQFAAIAWLRWRITVNSVRRKGGAGELIGRIAIWTMLGALMIVLVAGAGFVAFYFASSGRLGRISFLLWGVFLLCQLLNIQLGQPGTTFDPTQLIRFPLRMQSYVCIRLFFGLLTPSNVVVTLMSLAIAVGVGIAVPSLWGYALVALAVFAATNVLFSRMLFAWVDRWLSTRRAREVFTGLIFAFSIGIQWANFTFNPAYNHGSRSHTRGISPKQIHRATSFYHRGYPLLRVLPPELIDSSLLAAHHRAMVAFAEYTLGCALFALAFLAVFALRMRTEFRGENLSDAANAVAPKMAPSVKRSAPRAVAAMPVVAAGGTDALGGRAAFMAIFEKEFLYLRRHMGILYGLVMPILLVLIFASRFASHSNSVWIFPAAIAYTLLAICPLSYNSFGFEGVGSQFYFLAPVPMRTVMLAKNLFSFLMAGVEVLAIFAIITYIAGMPSLQIAGAALLWAAGTLALNSIVGNMRSFTSPKKINPQKMANRQASQLSAFISLGIVGLSSGIAAALFEGCLWTHMGWALVPVSAIFAAVGMGFYLQTLKSIDRFALEHREELFTELCKQS
jgi:ABC-2 type transport system permease protein